MTRPGRTFPELFYRSSHTPILTAADGPYPVKRVFNPGATRLADVPTLLLCRVEDRRGHSHFCIARSQDGTTQWVVDLEPTLLPDVENYLKELWGIEDPRVTYLPELDQYAIVYTSYSVSGPGVSLALTKAFRTFERRGVIMSPEDKNAALLPRRFNGQWVLIHRPVSHRLNTADMWISYSTDLTRWGNHKAMTEARRGDEWVFSSIEGLRTSRRRRQCRVSLRRDCGPGR